MQDISDISNLLNQSDNYYNEYSPNYLYSVDAAIHIAIKNPLRLKEAVTFVIERNLHGSANSFHALIELCKLFYDYDDAYELCKYAITCIHKSLLLYTDIIEIGMNYEDPAAKCDKYIQELLDHKSVGEVDKTCWNLKLYRAVFAYFNALVASNNIGGIQNDYFDQAIAAAVGMQAAFRGNEEGYFAEAELLVKTGKRADARKLLEDLISNPYEPEKDADRDLRCPKCCKLWLEEFKDYSGDLRMVRYVIAKGLRDSESKDDALYFSEEKARLERRKTALLDQIVSQEKENIEFDIMLGKITPDYSINTKKQQID